MPKAHPNLTKPVSVAAFSLDDQLDEVKRVRGIAQSQIRTDPACQFARIKRSQEEVARRRPPPQRPAPKPMTEAEQLLAMQPQSTAQTIGHHKIPRLPPPPPPPPKTWTEYEKLQATFPNSSSRVVGHHPDLLAERLAAARRASATRGLR